MPTTPRRAIFRTPCAMLAIAPLLTACGTSYTVDDGSKVDEQFLAAIRLYGKGQQAIRPAIVRSAQLHDKDCSSQWEIPFMATSSYELPKPAKIAWVRALHVDERLTVIAATPGSGLAAGDKIVELDGYSSANTLKMLTRLNELRNDGDPFIVKLADFKVVNIKPVKVCRGRVFIAPPENPTMRDYHWLQSTHPLQPFSVDLSEDEALWTVLWTQGIAEEGAIKMKTYHYGMGAIKAGINIASLVSGVKGAQVAAETIYKAAADQAAKAVGNAAAEAAAKETMKFAAQQVADSLRASAMDSMQRMIKAEAQQVAFQTVKAATVFKSSLSGTSWIAGFEFDSADKWALDRMAALGADPLAAFTLHYKLASAGLAANSLVLDEDRLKLMLDRAALRGFGDKVKLVLNGDDPNAPPAATTYTIAVEEGAEVRQLEALPLTADGSAAPLPVAAPASGAAPAIEEAAEAAPQISAPPSAP